MKFLVLALCVCAASAASVNSWAKGAANVAGGAAAVAAAPFVAAANAVYSAGSEVAAPILRSDSDVQPDGFNFAYETGNGISAESSGTLKKVGDIEAVVVQGSYRYTAPDGTPVVFNYIADENGYQPQSDLLPQAPEIPAAILRSLEYIAAHPPAQEPSGVAAQAYAGVRGYSNSITNLL